MQAADAGIGNNTFGAVTSAPWRPGDYPDDLTSDNFLTLPNLKGQRGFVRKYKVHVPPSYREDRPMPLVFCLHGLFQDTTMFCASAAPLQ